jgi:hypothetical protein
MTKNRKPRPSKNKGQNKSYRPLLTKNPKADFMPREIAIAGKTGEENFRSKELNY